VVIDNCGVPLKEMINYFHIENFISPSTIVLDVSTLK
jgi:hypothetical protein